MPERRHPFALTRPCADCPFRSDGAGILLDPGRVRSIERDLVRRSFNCHQTVNYDVEGEPDQNNAAHCAGALILLEKLGRRGDIQQIAQRLEVAAVAIHRCMR